MKKFLKLFTLSFALLFVFIIKVNAGMVYVVDNETSLKECLAVTGNTCRLDDNINVTSTINITDGKDVTIDLFSFKLTGASDLSELIKIKNGALRVMNELDVNETGGIFATKDAISLEGNINAGGSPVKAELEIESTVKVFSETSNAVYLIGNGAKVDIYGKVVSNSTKYAAIQGNGSAPTATVDKGNTEINIYEGAIVTSVYDVAIYHPQYGQLNVYGGEITGTTGIEMRAGVLTVDGGTITGTANPSSSTANGNGSTTVGVGIAIAQHTTKAVIDVSVAGGTIKGYKALVEVNPQGNTVQDVEKIALNITGGNFETINGGTVAVESENLTEFIAGGTFSSGVEKKYLVTDIKLEEKEDGSFVAKNYWSISIDEDIKNGTVTAVETAYEGDLVKLDIKPDKGYKVSSIKVLDHLDKEVKVTDNSFTMPTSPVFVEVTFDKDEAVPNTGDNIIMFVIIGLISLIGAGLAVNKLRKTA